MREQAVGGAWPGGEGGGGEVIVSKLCESSIATAYSQTVYTNI